MSISGMELMKFGRMQIVKGKSHITKSEAIAAGTSERAWEANRLADIAADAAAVRADYSPGDVQLLRRIDEAAEMVCRRMIAVGRFVVENRDPVVKIPRAQLRPLRDELMACLL